MKKTKTIDLKGKQYAQVSDRIKEFRDACPHGLIETTPTFNQDGSILFKARILKDKGDETSAESTGHALGPNKGEKSFEKLETIAVGRALALLGYASDGDIASGEEMEEFYDFQNSKREDIIDDLTDRIKNAKTIDELKSVWASVDGAFKVELNELKENKKKELENVNTKVRKPRAVAPSTQG